MRDQVSFTRSLKGRSIAAGLLALGGFALLAPATRAADATASPAPVVTPAKSGERVEWLYVTGTITAGTASYIARGVKKAEAEHLEAVVIQLDTPGGVLDATWDIVETELNSTVPIVVWVGPRGAHAGSAGVFITLASNVAAMAPATRIGAAHPVGLGEPGPEEPGAPQTPAPQPSATPVAHVTAAPGAGERPFVFKGDREHLAQKIENDTLAWVASIAQERGRNVEWAKKAVLDSDAIVAQDAVSRGVVDLIAGDREQLLDKLDGRLVKTSSGPVTLAVANATIDDEPMTPRERLFVLLADPTLIAILLGIAMLGLYTEFQHPGAILPAVVGGLAFLALLVGIQVVPIHYAGLLLIGIGFACFVLEIKITSYGLLTVAGIAAIAGGLFLLVDKSRFTVPVSWSVAVPGLGSMALIAAFLTWLAARAMRSTPLGDDRELVGRVVRAHTALTPAGTVTLDGVFWKAVSNRPVEAGASVRIVSAKGLTLEVEPAPAEAAPPVSFVAGGSAT